VPAVAQELTVEVRKTGPEQCVIGEGMVLMVFLPLEVVAVDLQQVLISAARTPLAAKEPMLQ
jgi:hypothetical protein